jgi:hypothetical protein
MMTTTPEPSDRLLPRHLGEPDPNFQLARAFAEPLNEAFAKVVAERDRELRTEEES